ncbi:MAG: hypothetical protein H6706_19230 [Myxococcales bacterium]|nr:hypothetical protein [Myxococcales bacterium]
MNAGTAALSAFYDDLAVLRRVPLHWLVPDEALLPPESLRLFFLDLGFIRQLFAGASAAGALGPEDRARDRQQADAQLTRVVEGWRAAMRLAADTYYRLLGLGIGAPAGPVDDRHLYVPTGMLLRSEAVQRYPGLRISAMARFDPTGTGNFVKLPLLRLERVAPGILIVLFMGIPEQYEIEEPDLGTRFGFDAPVAEDAPMTMQVRGLDGELRGAPVTVPLRDKRVLDVTGLVDRLAAAGAPGAAAFDSAVLAYQLQQAPYVQIGEASGAPAPAEAAAAAALPAEQAADAQARGTQP